MKHYLHLAWVESIHRNHWLKICRKYLTAALDSSRCHGSVIMQRTEIFRVEMRVFLCFSKLSVVKINISLMSNVGWHSSLLFSMTTWCHFLADVWALANKIHITACFCEYIKVYTFSHNLFLDKRKSDRLQITLPMRELQSDKTYSINTHLIDKHQLGVIWVENYCTF